MYVKIYKKVTKLIKMCKEIGLVDTVPEPCCRLCVRGTLNYIFLIQYFISFNVIQHSIDCCYEFINLLIVSCLPVKVTVLSV